MTSPITAILIGAGNRGARVYGEYGLHQPGDIDFVGVAEPDEARRARFATEHDVEPALHCATWNELLARPKLADAAVICTQDRMHVEPTLAALRAGYDVLLEKPMATSAADCLLLVNEAERLGRTLQICHVLRYAPFFTKLYELVNSGRLGDVITIEHRENVSWWHMAHSFVRGNWRNLSESAPMILAKCCHDLDILVWVMRQSVAHLSSFGSLAHYAPAHAPAGATQRCTDDCPAADACIFYAPRLYNARPAGAPITHPANKGNFEEHAFMLHALDGGRTPESRWRKLQTSQYGRCVYGTDNDVVDHQVIAMEFERGATCTFTMHGHGDREGRTLRIDGTKATLHGDFAHAPHPQFFTIHDHGGEHEERIEIDPGDSGHGGGDAGVIRDFVAGLRGKPSIHQTTARASLQSHMLAFAAEHSRTHGGVAVEMATFEGWVMSDGL